MMPQLCMSKVVHFPCQDKSKLRARLQGTIWEPGRAEEVVCGMRAQFPAIPLKACLWQRLQARLAHRELHLLQGFTAFQRSKGRDWACLPPAPFDARARSKLYAEALTTCCRRALEKRVTRRRPPTCLHRLRPSDVEFVEAVAVWREQLPAVARELRHVLKTVAQAVAPFGCCP